MNQSTAYRLRDQVEFAYPVRPWRLTKIDAGLVDENYYRIFGQWHRGVDINGIYGGDTDLGLPVQSMFPGTVVEVINASGWGQTVLVRSETWVRDMVAELLDVSADVLDVQYTHLHQVTVVKGDRVNAGDHLGSIGKGDRNQYPAHLHLEVRRLERPATVPQGGTDAAREAVLAQCLDPVYLMQKLPFGDFGNTMRPGTQVALVHQLEHNGEEVRGERLVFASRSGTRLLLDDDRDPPVVEEPTSLWIALLQAAKRWFDSRT